MRRKSSLCQKQLGVSALNYTGAHFALHWYGVAVDLPKVHRLMRTAFATLTGEAGVPNYLRTYK